MEQEGQVVGQQMCQRWDSSMEIDGVVAAVLIQGYCCELLDYVYEGLV